MSRSERAERATRRRDRQYRDDLRSLATLAANAEREPVERLTEEEWRAEQDPNGYRTDEYAAYLNNAKP